jgi:hypothetical protein
MDLFSLSPTKLRRSRDSSKMVKNSRPWIEINDQISLGEAAQEIARLTANLAGTKITDLGPHLDELSKQGQGPPPNICRRICSMSAEAELASGNANAFVNAIFPEPTEAMDDEEFDFQEPRMAHVSVTIEEEMKRVKTHTMSHDHMDRDQDKYKNAPKQLHNAPPEG